MLRRFLATLLALLLATGLLTGALIASADAAQAPTTISVTYDKPARTSPDGTTTCSAVHIKYRHTAPADVHGTFADVVQGNVSVTVVKADGSTFVYTAHPHPKPYNDCDNPDGS